jgi:DNA-directed RNA polymerase specialized sigma24 family protein
MASFFEYANYAGFASYLDIVNQATATQFRRVYEQNRHRIYSFSFWMTDSELEADELMQNTFCRSFALNTQPTPEDVDRAFVAELRDRMPIGTLTLECKATTEVENVRSNTMRVHMEQAVVQLPATERLVFLMHDVEGYDHALIIRLLGLNEEESANALHQARLKMRELVARIAAEERAALRAA